MDDTRREQLRRARSADELARLIVEGTAKKRSNASLPAALFSLVFLLPQLALNGFVVLTLWGWFVVPLGAPALTLPVAMGANLIFQALFPYSVVRYVSERDLKERPDRVHVAVEALAFSVVADLWFLAVGFVIYTFIH